MTTPTSTTSPRIGQNHPRRLLPFDERVDGALVAMADSYLIHLRALNRSPHSIAKYWNTLRDLGTFLAERGWPQRVGDIRREHLEAYVTEQLQRTSPKTAHGRYSDLHAFFEWCVQDEEIAEHPMRRMKAPRVPEQPPAVLREDMLRRLLAVCEGRDHDSLRDTAVICLLYDTGVRRSEIAGLRLSDIDWTLQTITITGKGGYTRTVPFGRKAARALDRYRRVRAQHRFATTTDALWLSRRLTFTGEGVYIMLRRRAAQAGLPSGTRVFTHLFRHSFAHAFLSGGGQEGDLMQLGGWHSREVMGRYGRSAAADRARDAHRQHSPLDRL